MEGGISMYVLLVFVSLDAGRLLMIATAQPAVFAVILTPEAERKEGGQVDMTCVASNLESDHIVEWRSTLPDVTLRWNDSTVTTNRRFMFTTTYPRRGMVVQDFTITDLQIDDYDSYGCYVRYPLLGGGNSVATTSSVILSAPYPMCSPSGHIALKSGAELQLSCLSKTDYPVVITRRSYPTNNHGDYDWKSSIVNDMTVLSLDMAVDAREDGVTFDCIVSTGQSHSVTRLCTIGPIRVLQAAISPQPTTCILSTSSEPDQLSPSDLWIIVSGITITLLGISFTVIVLDSFIIRKLRRLIKRLENETGSKDPQTSPHMEPEASPHMEPEASPYMELGPRENPTYMEPTTSTNPQHLYSQPVELET